MESLRRLTSSIFDSDARLGLTRRASTGGHAALLSPTSEAAAMAAQRFAPNGLDLTFITDRLIVMGFPVQGPTDKKRNQNNIDDVAEYLEMHHSNHYLIFNLNALDDDIHVQDLQAFISPSAAAATDATEASAATKSIASKVRHQMLEFTWERDGMKAHTPPFDLMFRLCYSIFAWLSLDASNVVLINCQTGKTRSGIVVACYLLYARLADDPADAFVEFYRKRWDMRSLTPEALRLKTPPSIHRFLSCFHDAIDNQRVPNIKPLLLKGIIIRAVPVEFQPCIQIWDDYRVLYCTSDQGQSHQQELSTSGRPPVIDWDSEEGCLAILWEDGLNLDGGFSILCSFGDEFDEDEAAQSIDASTKVLFRYADSTWFLAPGLTALTKSKLDMMKEYEDAFKEEHFSMDLVFVESKSARRKYVPIDCTGNLAVRQGVVEITKHHLVLPDPAMHSNFMKMGFSDVATTFALQRSQNAPNIALDLLHSSVLSTCFVQSAKAMQEERSRPALQSFSSSSLLTRNQSTGPSGSASASPTPPPLVRRQSTAEIAALQSQRSRYSTPTASNTGAICSVCTDDDYMMRPQIVRCTGPCGKFSHTICVGLKRIPFGLTTLSDRTNHAVYLKKYFSAWECDTCAAERVPLEIPEQRQHAVVRSPVTQATQASAPPRPSSSADWSARSVNSIGQSASPAAPALAARNPSATSGHEENIDKLKEFLAMSGVSVEDLLRAATTANVTISPSAGAIELPKSVAPSATAATPSSPRGALGKLFAAGASTKPGNPQESTPKEIVEAANEDRAGQAAAPMPSTAETTQITPVRSDVNDCTVLPTQNAARETAESLMEEKRPAVSSLGDGRSGLLAQIAARKSSDPNEATVSKKSDAAAVQGDITASAADPKEALLSQIAARRRRSGEDVVEIKAPLLQCNEFKNTNESKPHEESNDKYQTMLRRGVPFEAVQNCMKKDGADPSTLTPLSASPRQRPLSIELEIQAAASGTKLKDTDDFRSYFSMLRLGCPKEAVMQKILMDGADPVILDLGPDAIFEQVKDQIKLLSSTDKSTLQDDIKSVQSHKKVPKRAETANPEVHEVTEEDTKQSGADEVLLKDHEVYAKYFKMLKMGLPEDVVRHKMKQDVVDERALDLGGDAPFSKLHVAVAGVRLADDPGYAKYFKMLKMGLPQDAVRQKMTMDDADPRALELGPDAFVSQLEVKAVEVRLADDPVYAKYFKMLKMGLPQDAVRHKMVMEEVDPRALDLGPDAFVSQLTSASGNTAKRTAAPAKLKARRKKLHWQPISDDRLSNINCQTIWEDKDDDVMELDMDMAELESLFFASSDHKKKKTGAAQPAKTLKRKQSVTLIDGKRAMNAAISLARVKLSHAEIAHAVFTFDANGLTVEQLRGIRDSLPTAEEVGIVNNYNGDFGLLGDAEKFIKEISQVKRYTVRTECLLFRMSFPPRQQELKRSLNNITDACQQVKESRLLKILLSVVLKLGNTLNGSGEENEIRGFAVDSLLRLGHTKAVNQKTTVLHFLVRLVKKNHPAVLDFQSELQSVPLAARESFESVDEDFGKLQSGLTQLSEEFQDLQKDALDDQTQATVVSLQAAVESIGGQMESLDGTIKHARSEVRSVLEYFGEDPAKNPTEFFSTLSSFCSLFVAARKEVDATDEAALRAERVKMRRNAIMRPSSSTAAGSSTAPTGTLERQTKDKDRASSDRSLVAPPRVMKDDRS